MAVRGVELLVARRNTERIIAEDPTTVSLVRRVRIETPSGGWRWGPGGVIPPQQFCLLPFKRRLTDSVVNTEEGEFTLLPYVLMGHHDADVQRDDTFELGDEHYRVMRLDIGQREIRTVAEIAFLGEGKNG